jgi:hypothetical protein
VVVEGTYTESFNKGYFAFLDLPVGTHTVVFGGASQDLATRTTAEISVVPLPLPALLLGAGLLSLGVAARSRRVEV